MMNGHSNLDNYRINHDVFRQKRALCALHHSTAVEQVSCCIPEGTPTDRANTNIVKKKKGEQSSDGSAYSDELT